MERSGFEVTAVRDKIYRAIKAVAQSEMNLIF